jgi:hypothetical protein
VLKRGLYIYLFVLISLITFSQLLCVFYLINVLKFTSCGSSCVQRLLVLECLNYTLHLMFRAVFWVILPYRMIVISEVRTASISLMMVCAVPVLGQRPVGELAACAVPVLSQRPRVGFSGEESRQVVSPVKSRGSDRSCSCVASQVAGRRLMFWVRVRVTLRLTVSQPVRLGVEPLLGLMTRF